MATETRSKSTIITDGIINEISIGMMHRYTPLIEKLDYIYKTKLLAMAEFCSEHPYIYTDEMSRYLGFMQGILYSNGLIDIKAERQAMKEEFRYIYKNLGLEIPEPRSELNIPDILDE